MKSLSHWPKIALPVLAAFLFGSVFQEIHSQEFLRAEYRVDGGPAWAMSLISSNTTPQYREGEFVADVTAVNLAVGPHYYEVRLRGTNNVWSAWQGDWFRVSGETHLVAAEWYVDADPGYGLGTPILVPEDGAWDESEEDFVVPGVTVTNLEVGRHQLIIRAKDSNGDWGIPSQTTFYVAPAVTIAAAVWTTNLMDFGDPALILPATNQMQAADGAFDEDSEDMIATVNTLALATNYCLNRTLYVRCQDSLGRWSTRQGLWFDAAAQTWRFDPAAGWGTNSLPLTVSPEVASSPAPGNWNLVVTSNNSVVLDWNDCRGISGYEVYFRSSPTNALNLVAGGFTNSTLTLVNLPASGNGEWLIRSMGDPGCGRDGSLWRFGFAQPRLDDADQDGLPDAWERSYFVSLNAFNGSTDRDNDGFKDWQEWVAGTSPTNRLDYFMTPSCRLGSFNPFVELPAMVLDWQSVTGRTYNLYYATQLQSPVTVWRLLEQLPGTGGSISYTNDWPDPIGFYSLGVNMPSNP
ncbi:MAG TPA: hypothetical protein VJA21_33025 [Verrucomicrobiae bacterium]